MKNSSKNLDKLKSIPEIAIILLYLVIFVVCILAFKREARRVYYQRMFYYLNEAEKDK